MALYPSLPMGGVQPKSLGSNSASATTSDRAKDITLNLSESILNYKLIIIRYRDTVEASPSNIPFDCAFFFIPQATQTIRYRFPVYSGRTRGFVQVRPNDSYSSLIATIDTDYNFSGNTVITVEILGVN